MNSWFFLSLPGEVDRVSARLKARKKPPRTSFLPSPRIQTRNSVKFPKVRARWSSTIAAHGNRRFESRMIIIHASLVILLETSLPLRSLGEGRAVSSVVERLVYTERVGGSKPSPPSFSLSGYLTDPEMINPSQESISATAASQ